MAPSNPSGSEGKRLGQVLASSTRSFTAQARELHRPPPLGALVRAEGPAGASIYAVVIGSQTESVEGRLPMATGWDLPDGAAVLREEPHLPKLLRTTFEAAVVSYDPSTPLRTGPATAPFVPRQAQGAPGALRTSPSTPLRTSPGPGPRVGLPPAPAAIYGFVQECPPEGDVAQALAAGLDFLPLLLSATPPGLAEEAAVACLRLLAEGQRDREAFLLRAGKRLAVLLSHEPARLDSALRRLE